MPYCEPKDVLVFAPQAPPSEEFVDEIAMADGEIDAILRGLYTVPLSPVDQIIVTVSAKMAAAIWLAANQARVTMEPSKRAGALEKEAIAKLKEIVGNPALLSIEPREMEAEDAEKSSVLTVTDTGGVFNMGDETKWGV